ncbi:MAG: hypothetical protein WCW03_00775 [Candidatus Paceibacterota bacterium]|jgi:hypothetical protein
MITKADLIALDALISELPTMSLMVTDLNPHLEEIVREFRHCGQLAFEVGPAHGDPRTLVARIIVPGTGATLAFDWHPETIAKRLALANASVHNN